MEVNVKQLKARWQTPEGQDLQVRVLHALRKGRKLEGMDGVGLVNGRFDLRGLAVPRPEVTGSSAFKNYELSFLSGRIEFRRIILDKP